MLAASSLSNSIFMAAKNTDKRAKNWKTTDIDEMYPKVFRLGMKTIIRLKNAKIIAIVNRSIHEIPFISFPQKL
jgi:hypothetical protein